MANEKSKITCLEQYAREIRNTHNDWNYDYTKDNPYASNDGKSILTQSAPLLNELFIKGTNHQGHSDWLPSAADDNTKSGNFDYSNFDTFNGGNCIDVAKREQGKKRSLYTSDSYYSKSSIDDEYKQQTFEIT